jgi:hypothetical protein
MKTLLAHCRDSSRLAAARSFVSNAGRGFRSEKNLTGKTIERGPQAGNLKCCNQVLKMET